MGGATGRPGAKLCPYFTLCFVRVYHYAISELCKGLYHHNGVCHVTSRVTSPHVLGFTGFDQDHEARAPPLGVCLPHQRCGDGEVSESGVSEGVCGPPRDLHGVVHDDGNRNADLP